MKRLLGLTLAGLLVSLSAHAQAPASLDELLEQVRSEHAAAREENSAREARFLAARDQQQRLLEEARAELAALERRATELKARYEANAKRNAERQALLDERTGALGELFGHLRQVAAEAKGVVESSVVSAQKPGRANFLERLAQGKEVPSIAELEGLWHLMLEEMTEAGKVARFSAPVITVSGEEQARQVTRAGVFTAVSEGRFLRYLPETGHLVELARQPAARHQAAAQALEQAEAAVVTAPLDPTRGSVLALLAQSPDLMERIRQGGGIGYVIMGLGALALLIGLERFIVLGRTGAKVRRQLQNERPQPDNPLGRIMHVYEENPTQEAETLSLKLDEAILREMPRIQRGLGTIAILAAVAPLLGLLGTVTGMIQTFQSITLFGTGDPKLMSGGISLALVTTEQGLAVAIPVLLLHSFLTSKSNRIIQVLDEQSAAMVARMAEHRHDGHRVTTA